MCWCSGAKAVTTCSASWCLLCRARGLRVEVQDGWVDDLVGLFNSAKVYIYDSADHWRAAGVSEGFGLPPLEAMACGCVVFSSLNHALADTLTPGEIGHQIGCGSLDHDVNRIVNAVSAPADWTPSGALLDALLKPYSEPVLVTRWQGVLQQLDALQPTLATTQCCVPGRCGACAGTGVAAGSCGWSIGCLSGLQPVRVEGQNGLCSKHLWLDRLVSSKVDC